MDSDDTGRSEARHGDQNIQKIAIFVRLLSVGQSESDFFEKKLIFVFKMRSHLFLKCIIF